MWILRIDCCTFVCTFKTNVCVVCRYYQRSGGLRSSNIIKKICIHNYSKYIPSIVSKHPEEIHYLHEENKIFGNFVQ